LRKRPAENGDGGGEDHAGAVPRLVSGVEEQSGTIQIGMVAEREIRLRLAGNDARQMEDDIRLLPHELGRFARFGKIADMDRDMRRGDRFLFERNDVVQIERGDRAIADGLLPHESCDKLAPDHARGTRDRKSTRLNSSHVKISYAVFCLKKKKNKKK